MSDLKLTTLVTSLERAIRNTDEANVATVDQRRETIALVIGGIIGSWMPIPGTQAQSRELYYITHIYPSVTTVLNTLIEVFNFDINLTLEATRAIWAERYSYVHNKTCDVSCILERLTHSFNEMGTGMDIERFNSITRVLSGSQKEDLNLIVSNLRNYLSEEGVLA